MSNGLVKYLPIAIRKIDLTDNSVTGIDINGLNGVSAATVAVTGGDINYSVLEGEDPSQQYGRPINDREEYNLINREWIDAFRMIRTGTETVYVTVFLYSNA